MSSKKQSTLVISRRDKFCRYYLFGSKEHKFRFANAVRSYCAAFDKDHKNPKHYNMAGVEGHKLLKNPKIKERMGELLEEYGFRDEVVDSRLIQIIKFGDDDDAMKGIREYNSLKNRVNKTDPNAIGAGILALLGQMASNNNKTPDAKARD